MAFRRVYLLDASVILSEGKLTRIGVIKEWRVQRVVVQFIAVVSLFTITVVLVWGPCK